MAVAPRISQWLYMAGWATFGMPLFLITIKWFWTLKPSGWMDWVGWMGLYLWTLVCSEHSSAVLKSGAQWSTWFYLDWVASVWCCLIRDDQHASIPAWPRLGPSCWYILNPATHRLHATFPPSEAEPVSQLSRQRWARLLLPLLANLFLPPGQRAFPKPQGGKVGKVGVWVGRLRLLCFPSHPPPQLILFMRPSRSRIREPRQCVSSLSSDSLSLAGSHMRRYRDIVEATQDAKTKKHFGQWCFLPRLKLLL